MADFLLNVLLDDDDDHHPDHDNDFVYGCEMTCNFPYHFQISMTDNKDY